jgi:hypothetical protein
MTLEECEQIVERFVIALMVRVQDRTADYLRRGRRFAATPTADLRALYTQAECVLACGVPHSPILPDGEDAESELTLRGEPLPEEDLVVAKDLIRQQVVLWGELTGDDEEKMEKLFAPAYKPRETMH